MTFTAISKDGAAKETGATRIAVTVENGEVFQHFGHSEQFLFCDVVNGTITKRQIVPTNGKGHGALAAFLKENLVNQVICGGIGGGAQDALKEAGIELYGGVTGNAEAAAQALAAGTLEYNPAVHCDHHDHEHGEGGHDCGSHDCGSHSCH